jgi:uncharacterized protein
MAAAPLAPFVRQRTVLLTTYRRDGTPVATPVNIAVEGGRAFVRTFEGAWKLKRMRNNPSVEIAPATVGGKPTGAALPGRARILSGDEAAHASREIVKKYPVLHGLIVPVVHRLRRTSTVHFEIIPE